MFPSVKCCPVFCTAGCMLVLDTHPISTERLRCCQPLSFPGHTPSVPLHRQCGGVTVSILVLIEIALLKKKTNIKNQCIGLWISQEHESVKKGELWLYRRKDGAYICILVPILHLKCCCFLLCQHLGTCCSSLRVSLDALDALRGLR